ncbi:histidine kinase group protein [Hirsutella rhossiliensis]|uniref:Histidine kinase group protein n=1 Tax=Hirsutella rhossiliensis TaxID=111463 RepID=A0A9P8MTD1_9HYPO|nr:histidine kinase group protein [Hirsutella rhossiliensis]KAH0960885.1 histidine kinase group protein [Hirsutella rhossiliensis]
MAKKKPKQPSVAGEDGAADKSPRSPDAPAPPPQQPSAAKKSSRAPSEASVTPSSSSLIICRNKHWRHISSFHGAWLQMPTEILETIANINYNTQRPRPIDPAILFDLIKIRKNVDEAADLAVRAASDTASPTLSSVNGGMPGVSSMNAFGLGLTGHGTKLSRERRFRMRELASQKLARAYRLDEIASSVATMQGASTLEDIGALVLQHSPEDPDAKYVHFFHQKIPSRHLAESTSLQPLEDIMSTRAGQPEVLRTLATVKIFKGDLDGAAQDLTDAMALSRYRGESHRSSADSVQQAQQAQGSRRRLPDVILSQDGQPSGLDSQLLFQRGCVYLSMASLCVSDGIPCPTAPSAEANGSEKHAADDADHDGPDAEKRDADTSAEALKLQADSRRHVKFMAKRALRDLMAFLAQFDYTPDMPIKLNKEFNERVFLASQGVRNPRCSDAGGPLEPHTLYSLAELFSAVPPSNLPAYPSQDMVRRDELSPRPATTCEWVTYHPLLTEALHSLLLCHCLAQTSVKELQRHAYMVARLVRLCEGYPVFQASRSPARTDWVEVLRRAKNWLNLSPSWESLCFPAPLPVYDPHPHPASAAHDPARATAATALINGSSAVSAQENRKATLPEPNPAEDIPGKRTVDRQVTHQATTSAKKKDAALDVKSSAGIGPSRSDSTPAPAPVSLESAVWWASDDGRDYPIASDRSVCIAQWVLEAPQVTGIKRKKRAKKSTAKVGEAAEDLAKLDFGEANDA